VIAGTMAIDSDGLPDPARVVLRRRIEWMDTDAAGIYHWTTVFRLAEAAEAAMHTALGIADFTFGATPRVSVAATFSRSLRFNEPVEVELAVVALGRTSVEYALRIEAGAGTAAQGTVKSVLVDRESGRAAPWPDDVRERLAGAGLQQPPD
jgi:acyl-CoA thioesterase FadM